jgi:hypothetical protein
MTKPRDYRHEYQAYQGTPEQIKNRAARNKARREMEKKLGKAAIEGKDVGHIKPLINGGSNKPSNTKVQAVKPNRGWRRGKHNYEP